MTHHFLGFDRKRRIPYFYPHHGYGMRPSAFDEELEDLEGKNIINRFCHKRIAVIFESLVTTFEGSIIFESPGEKIVPSLKPNHDMEV